MKKFYFLLFAIPVLLFAILYLSIWWFFAVIAVISAIAAYQFYAARLAAMQTKNEILEQQVEELHVQLDTSILKEQRVSKEAENIRQLKKQLLTIISHEIRTPMNGVMGMALMLEDTSLTSEQKEYIKTIRSCGESLLTTVNDILANDALDFSKLEQEEKKLEYKDFDLRDCVEETLDMFAGKAAKTGFDLLYEIDANVPAQIIGDNKRIRQIIMNLVENAVKFTSHGEVFVGLHLKNNEKGNNPEISFEVRDTGSGIDNDQLKQLFKGIPSKEIQKGAEQQTSGLGLVICRKLAELMGGSIEVKSQQGQGSTFTFTIPVIPSLKATRSHAQIDNMVNLEGKRILVADDNSVSRTILMKQMQLWKMLPTGADSGMQALDVLSKSNFDIVLIDLNMPVMNGIELARTIRSNYSSTPIMLMNAAGDEQYKQEPEFFRSVVKKPIRQNILRDQLLSLFVQTVADKQTATSPMTDNFAKQFPLRILIAEDNLINQKIAIKILTKLGYEPALANNGKEVMEMVGHEHYDIILMDVQMPEMDGLEATRMIRTCLEVQPIIMAMTANVLQGDRDDCMQAGMDDYISKPIDLKELLSQLEKWAIAIKSKRKISA